MTPLTHSYKHGGSSKETLKLEAQRLSYVHDEKYDEKHSVHSMQRYFLFLNIPST